MKKIRNPKSEIRNPDARGITSVVVVFILVTLLTLIGIGFTKVMNRSLQSSSADAQASAATYAAQSAINDAAEYLQQNPQTTATNCNDLIKAGAPLAEAAKLSADGNTAYTCVLVDPNPTSLFYQNQAPYKSQIIKVTTTVPLSSLLFSWQAVDRNLNQFVPGADGQTLLDETAWAGKKYAPLLRLSLYPIPSNGDLGPAQSNAKTFFLYPQTGGGSNSLGYETASGLHSVNCSSKNLGTFAGSADYDCNVVISNLGSANASYFYATVTPYYGQSSVKVKGNDNGGQASKFKDVQSVVDVTAKSGSSIKRLQARIDSSGGSGDTNFNISSSSHDAPDFGLRVSNTLCKRLLVPPSKNDPAQIETGSSTNCGFSLSGPPPAVPPPAAPAPGDTGGDSQPQSGGGPSAKPDCFLTIGSDGKPLGYACTNSWKGGQLKIKDLGNGCTQYTEVDWNYAGVDKDSKIVCTGSGGPPTIIDVPDPDSPCGVGFIGDPGNCTPNWILDMGGGRCPDGYQGTPQLEPGVWYGPPGTVYPGCTLPPIVEPQGSPGTGVTPGVSGSGGSSGSGSGGSSGSWGNYDPIIQFPPQEPAWDPCAGDCWSPPEPVYDPPWSPPAQPPADGGGGGGCGLNNKNRVWPFYGNMSLPRYFGRFIC